MSVIEAIKNGARPAALAIMLATIGPAANAQQPSAAAMSDRERTYCGRRRYKPFQPADRGRRRAGESFVSAAGPKPGEGPE